MPNLNVDSRFSELSKRLADSFHLSSEASNFYIQRNGHSHRIKHPQIHQITELAFLSVFLAWEDFLESTFLRYMCGAITKAGYRPKTYVSPKSLDHALNMLKGRRPYLDWSIAEELIDRAGVVFKNGEPFSSAIRPLIADLNNMRSIRNAIAHRSEYSINNFERVVREILGSKPRGLNPGMFLALTNEDVGKPYIEYYKDILCFAAKGIIR